MEPVGTMLLTIMRDLLTSRNSYSNDCILIAWKQFLNKEKETTPWISERQSTYFFENDYFQRNLENFVRLTVFLKPHD